jgi:hypothetical protein
MSDRYEESRRRLRAQYEANKTPADKLRDRLAYAKNLRAKSNSINQFVEDLNSRLQRGTGDLVLKWRPLRRTWAFVFKQHNIVLTEAQMEQVFTWAFQASKDLRAHAERIESELTQEVPNE